ncbi:hypothetical protein XENORESO_012714 [Xenotaenia resolanae]|uniref:Uncharacterized protein n=1 Tax=Xenotaenia resolanae TaxID=208358 RepID=A0ABV0WFN9_9TELE
MNVIINSPNFRSQLLHRPTSASGYNFPGFLLEQSQLSWALIPKTVLDKILPKGCCTPAMLITICSSEDREMKLAMRIKKTWKQDIAEPISRQKEKTWQVMGLKDPMLSNIQRHAANLWNLKEDSTLQTSFWKQLSLKAASRKDGVYVHGQPLLATKKNKGSIYRSQYAIRPAPHNDIEYFSETLNTKEAERHSLKAERKVENSHTNRENGNKQILAYRLQMQQTHKANYHDASVEKKPSDVRENSFIMLIPHAEIEAQAEPSKAANTEMRWETIKELGDPPPFIKSLKDFISETTDKSKCNCFVGKNCLLKLYLIDPTAMTDLKLAKKLSEVTTISASTEKREAPQENAPVNTTEEANTTVEESVIPSPPSLKVMQTETTTARSLTEASSIKMETQDTTEVFSQSSKTDIQPSGDQTQTTLPDPDPETDFEPRFIKCITHNTHVPPKVQFSGLRIRHDVPVIITNLDKDTKNDVKGSANWAAADRKHGLYHHEGESQTFSRSSENIQKEGADKDLKTASSTASLCSGLIDRSVAGWKHCVERRGGPSSKPVSVWETSDAGKLEKEPMRRSKQNPLSDKDDHFYYFNGALKRVQNNVQVYYERQRRRRHSFRTTENDIKEKWEQPQDNLQSYIQRLIKKNKVDHFT